MTMNLNILPTLQQMSSVVIASHLFRNSDMERLLQESQAKTREFHSEYECIHEQEFEHWQHIKQWAVEHLNICSSVHIKNSVAKLVRPMYLTADNWLADHQFLQRNFLGLLCNGYICWRTDGMIDRTKTALKITRNENIDMQFRFVIACIYFLDSEVMILWRAIKDSELRERFRDRRNGIASGTAAVNFWMAIIKSGAHLVWNKIARINLAEFNFEYKLIKSRFSSFCHLLSKESKKSLITPMWLRTPHQDDLRLYLREISEDQLPELIHSNLIQVLDLVLKWPNQSLFTTFVNFYLSHTNLNSFEFILKFIIRTTIMQCLTDFDYVELFKDFWNSSPVSHKDYIREKEGWLEIMESIMGDDAENANRSWVQTLSGPFFALTS